MRSGIELSQLLRICLPTFASFFYCTPVGRGSDFMMAPHKAIYKLVGAGTNAVA